MIDGRTKVSLRQMREAYAKTGSVHAAGRLLGISGSSVHERLVRNGVKFGYQPFSDAEKERLKRDYRSYRNDKMLDLLAQEMGRTKQFLCRQARALGLTGGPR